MITRGVSALDLAEAANPHVGMHLDDGRPNPEFESMLAMAEAVKAGKANAMLSTDGFLQARRLDREPAARTFEGWVKALHAFMTFTGKPKPFQCTRADAVAYEDALLARMSRSTTKTQLAYLALWTKPPRAKHSAQHRRNVTNPLSRPFLTKSGLVQYTSQCSSSCTSPAVV